MYKTIFAVFLFSLSSLSHADCSSIIAGVSKRLSYPNNSEVDGELSFTSCKIWPADPTKTIVALAHFQKGSSFTVPPTPGIGLYDLDILVVRSEDGEVVQRLFQKGELISDSIGLKGITIDTAPYTLARNLRAFGVRARYSYLAVSSAEYEKISLYVERGEKLTEIVKQLVVVRNVYERIDECADRSSETTRTIAVSGSTSHGFADLTVREKMVNREGSLSRNKCIVTESPSSRQYVLRFDGNRYPVPKELQE